MSSFPLPVSPWTRTVEFVGATASTWRRTWRSDRAVTDDLLKVKLAADLIFKIEVLLFELIGELSNPTIGKCIVDGDRHLSRYL